MKRIPLHAMGVTVSVNTDEAPARIMAESRNGFNGSTGLCLKSQNAVMCGDFL
jgi:hypothetical protein